MIRFGGRRPFPFPNLVDLQTASYQTFLQEDVPGEHRTESGLEALLREVFPIYVVRQDDVASSTSATSSGSPRYTTDECRKLRLTYGCPFKVRVRLEQARAGRGGGLPRRDPDHDRRRRVHHQRHRARDRQPAPPLAGRRLLGRHAQPSDKKLHSLLDHPRARLVDRAERHQEGRARRSASTSRASSRRRRSCARSTEKFVDRRSDHPAQLLHDRRQEGQAQTRGRLRRSDHRQARRSATSSTPRPARCSCRRARRSPRRAALEIVARAT